MTVGIGVISVRDEKYHPNRRLMEAASARGHAVIRIHPYRYWPGFQGRGKALFFQEDAQVVPDVVLPRQGADVGSSCLALIRQFQLAGIPVVNDFDAVRISRHQFYTLQALATAGIPFPGSVFVNSPDGLRRAVEALGGYPVVVKQVSRRQGNGVVRIDSDSMARAIIAGHLERPQKERPGLLVQRYLPPSRRRDIRVLIIGSKVAGAQSLTPAAGDFRANFHLSGRSRTVSLPAAVEDLSIRAARAVGLDIAGVDIMMGEDGVPYVGEVNYAPGFKGLEAATGLDIAGEIIDYAVERIATG